MRRDSAAPWYRKSKGCWYGWVGGRQVSLKVKGIENRDAALLALARLQVTGAARPVKATGRATVATAVAGFLVGYARRVGAWTLSVRRALLGMFVARFGTVSVAALDPDAVEEWVAGYGSSSSSRYTLLSAVKTCVRWAVAEYGLPADPLVGIRMPAQVSRGAKVALTEEQFARLLRCAGRPTFRVFLLALWHTGARPGELARLTAADVDLDAGVAVLHQHKTAARTGKPRLIFLAPEAVELFRAQVAAHPDGALFRNAWGGAWVRDTIIRAMQRARARAGLPHAIPYGLRHSFATAALVKGIPDATVAALLGHVGTAMLHKHYSHLTARAQAMRAAAAQVRGGSAAPVQGESHQRRAQS